MMVKEIPLPPIFHDGMMIRPAIDRRFIHDDSLEFKRPHRAVSHAIGQRFRLVPHPWKGKIVFPFPFKDKRPFLESVGQSRHRHRFRSKFHHIIFQLCHHHAAACPVDITLSVLVRQHTRVNAVHSFYGTHLRHKGAAWLVRYGHSYSKSLFHAPRGSRKIEIILAILADTVRCPHGIGVRSGPRNAFLADNDPMVFPMRQVIGREHMVIGHTEPFFQPFYRAGNVVRRVQIYLSIKDPRCGIGRKLIADYGILCLRPACHEAKKDCNG